MHEALRDPSHKDEDARPFFSSVSSPRPRRTFLTEAKHMAKPSAEGTGEIVRAA
jgi:hypothetical protein